MGSNPSFPKIIKIAHIRKKKGKRSNQKKIIEVE